MEITKDSLIPDVLAGVPGARTVFDRYGLMGCGGAGGPRETLDFFAKVHAVDVATLIEEIKDSKPTPDLPPEPADVLYRRFFKAGIVVILTAGALLGAVALFLYGRRGSFTHADLFALVQAHANAQVYGWVGLFVMGFAIQAIPRFKYTKLHSPRLAALSFALMLAGIAARLASAFPMGEASIVVGTAGGSLEAAAAWLFVYVMLRTLRTGLVKDSYDRYVFASLIFFAAAAAIEPFVYAFVFSAPTFDEMQTRAALHGPYRDLQLAGFAAFMIFGVSQRILPTAFGFREVSADASMRAFFYLLGGLALSLALPWAGHFLYFLGALILARELAVFGKAVPDRSVKFIRAAYAWLMIAGALWFLAPIAGSTHAWIGAFRHAFTVGFISMMIVGVSLRIVPILSGADPSRLPAMTATFWLLNIGNGARVLFQILTDHASWAFALMGPTGMIEVLALALWGVHVWRVLDGRFTRATAAAKPSRIEGSMIVADVIEAFPETLEVFVTFGFGMLRNPLLRNSLGRSVTVERACGMHGVDSAELLRALNGAANLAPPAALSAETPSRT